jgi:hypothetical protein
MKSQTKFTASVRLTVSLSLVLVTSWAFAQEVLMNIVLVPSLDQLNLSSNFKAALKNDIAKNLPEQIGFSSESNADRRMIGGLADVSPVSVSLFRNRNLLTMNYSENLRMTSGQNDEQIESSERVKFASEFIAANQDVIERAEALSGKTVGDFNSLAIILELVDNGLIGEKDIDPIQLKQLRIAFGDYLAKVYAGSAQLVDFEVSGFIDLFTRIFGLIAQTEQIDFESLKESCSSLFAQRLKMESMTLKKLACYLSGPHKNTIFLDSGILTNKLILTMLASSLTSNSIKTENFFTDLKATPMTFTLYKTSGSSSQVFIDGYIGSELLQLCPGKIKKCPLTDFSKELEAHFDSDYRLFLSPISSSDGVLEFTSILFCLSVLFIVVGVIYDCVQRKSAAALETQELCQN